MALKLSCVGERLQKCLPKFTLNYKSNSYSASSLSGIRSIEHNLRYVSISLLILVKLEVLSYFEVSGGCSFEFQLAIS